MFLVRRMTFAMIVVYLTDYSYFQLQLIILQSSFMMIYIFSNPFLDWKLNFLEIFNEGCLMLCSYHCLAFTDYVDEIETKYLIGYSAFFLAGINILTNIGNLLFEIIKSLKRTYSKCRKNKSVRKGVYLVESPKN